MSILLILLILLILPLAPCMDIIPGIYTSPCVQRYQEFSFYMISTLTVNSTYMSLASVIHPDSLCEQNVLLTSYVAGNYSRGPPGSAVVENPYENSNDGSSDDVMIDAPAQWNITWETQLFTPTNVFMAGILQSQCRLPFKENEPTDILGSGCPPLHYSNCSQHYDVIQVSTIALYIGKSDNYTSCAPGVRPTMMSSIIFWAQGFQPTPTPETNSSSGEGDGADVPIITSPLENSSDVKWGIGLGVGFGFALLAVGTFLLVRYLRKRRANDGEVGLKQTLLADYQDFNKNLTASSGNTTIINTFHETSIPGFMEMTYGTDFRCEKQLKVGGEALVYSGIFLNPKLQSEQKTIVIKQFHTSKNFDVTKFKQEVAVLYSLESSPYVIRLLGFSLDPYCIIMPLYLGDLGTFVHDKQQHSYTFGHMIEMIKQLILGLKVIHQQGFAHRDLKPINVLMERKSKESTTFNYNLKIGDFGICYVENEHQLPSPHTNKFGLSYAYAAPEIFKRFRSAPNSATLADFQAADVYAFAVTVWEILHRKVPWEGENPRSIERKVISGERPAIRNDLGVGSNVQAIKQMIGQCWSESPTNRPNFATLAIELKTLMDLTGFQNGILSLPII